MVMAFVGASFASWKHGVQIQCPSENSVQMTVFGHSESSKQQIGMQLASWLPELDSMRIGSCRLALLV